VALPSALAEGTGGPVPSVDPEAATRARRGQPNIRGVAARRPAGRSALAGLVFVAVSINLGEILKYRNLLLPRCSIAPSG